MRPAWLLLVCLVGFPLGSRGDDVVARMTVSAQVVPHVRLEAHGATAPVAVTAADVARGYVDVARRYRLRGNVAPGQVLLQLHPRLGYTQAIDVEGFGATLRLLDTSLEVVPARLEPDFDLAFRLWLAPGTAPGAYPWPVHLAAVASAPQ